MERERRFPWLLMLPVIAALTAFALTVASNRIFRGGWWPPAGRVALPVILAAVFGSVPVLIHFRRQKRTHVARIDLSNDTLRQEVLERLRRLDVEPMPTQYWRWENYDGSRVLAEQKGGEVIIYRDVCRELLGEEV